MQRNHTMQKGVYENLIGVSVNLTCAAARMRELKLEEVARELDEAAFRARLAATILVKESD